MSTNFKNPFEGWTLVKLTAVLGIIATYLVVQSWEDKGADITVMTYCSAAIFYTFVPTFTVWMRLENRKENM